MVINMDYWKFSGERLCEMADEVLHKRRATDDACIEAIAQLREAARQRYLGAYIRLARCYERGIGVAADETRAMEYYRRAADCGDEAAAKEAVRLNPLYHPKKLSETDEGSLLELDPADDLTAAELADAAGKAERDGDKKRAAELYRYAAKMGHPAAQLRYAQLLEADDQTEHAIRWYRRAAQQGQAEARAAMTRLDTLYDPALPDTDSLTGDQLYILAADFRTGEHANPALVTALNELAAARSSGKAALALAQEYCDKGDDVGALPHIRTAADAGIPAALDLLGCFNEAGRGGVEKNDKAAFRNYVRAAEGGSADGCFHAGMCCKNGVGTAANITRAAEWYAKGAVLGSANAQEQLKSMATADAPTAVKYRCGHFFLYGDRNGQHRDFRLAYEMLQAAAGDQMPEACFDLGIMYRDGRYVYDKRKAREYLDKAAQFGVTGAVSERKKVYRKTIVYVRELTKALLILAVCLCLSVFVAHQLKLTGVLDAAKAASAPAWIMIAVGGVALLVKHYFIFSRTSVRPWYQNLLFTLLCPGIIFAVLTILAGCGVLERYALGVAFVLAAILTVFLIQHDSVVRDAIWVGLRLVIFIVGAILLGQVLAPLFVSRGWAFWEAISDPIAIAILVVSALVLLIKQFYLYCERLDIDAFLLSALLCLLWPGLFLAGLLWFCWIVLPSGGLLALSVALGTVLHCLISENIWGCRETD